MSAITASYIDAEASGNNTNNDVTAHDVSGEICGAASEMNGSSVPHVTSRVYCVRVEVLFKLKNVRQHRGYLLQPGSFHKQVKSPSCL